MPTRFSVFRRSDHEISITCTISKAQKCLQLSNMGFAKEIDADGFAPDATSVVAMLKSFA
jgi:hypothetical protein